MKINIIEYDASNVEITFGGQLFPLSSFDYGSGVPPQAVRSRIQSRGFCTWLRAQLRQDGPDERVAAKSK